LVRQVKEFPGAKRWRTRARSLAVELLHLPPKAAGVEPHRPCSGSGYSVLTPKDATVAFRQPGRDRPGAACCLNSFGQRLLQLFPKFREIKTCKDMPVMLAFVSSSSSGIIRQDRCCSCEHGSSAGGSQHG